MTAALFSCPHDCHIANLKLVAVKRSGNISVVLNNPRLGRAFTSAISVGSHRRRLNHKGAGVNCDRLGGIVRLVDADQAVRQLKHVVAQTDDHELRVLGPLLDVVRHDAHILEVCMATSLLTTVAKKGSQIKRDVQLMQPHL